MSDFKQEVTKLQPRIDYQLYLSSSWGMEVAINSSQLWPCASLIKLGIAEYGQQIALKKPELLTEKVTLLPADIVGGAGTLQLLSPQTYTVKDLLQLMLIQSDNTATNALLSTWQLAKIQAWLNQNYPQVLLQRRLMAPAVNGENLATAKSIAQLLAACFDYQDEYGQTVQVSLHHQMSHDKLVWPVNIGEYTKIKTYNKTGELLGYDHDAARFYLGDAWLDCVVMTKYATGKRSQAVTFLQSVGRLLCQTLVEYQQ
ncbi:class A beta-lactamase-related serine hydrolase [Lactobacillus sp. ESL0684]|uniref:serine hydrolase n=1 Tax=Lactobacillus sp. ESL0684 TaxID=2983213 RepID=UPI0023F64BB8|nr:serine hydrolase [Lactobacillus sp. ESL0684]WEV44000.1 class A beta-lactamase-related serine hydrolase [Lactobacillus sp. ESL0684]